MIFLVINMEISKWKMVSYISILLIICICSFLVAKFLVRSGIHNGDIPVDTSVRLD